jgi:predicted DsbA family dithiol-disulfide isomerase
MSARRPARTPVRLEIVSDVVCPWCYLGWGNLAQALAGRDPSPFEIVWRPYQLDPDLPAEGADRTAYMTAKFGDLARVAPIHDRIAAGLAAVGLPVDFDAIRRTPNTLPCHVLIARAQAAGRGTAAAAALFRRYWAEGADVSAEPTLAAVAAEIGLPPAAAEGLRDPASPDARAVAAEIAAARRMGVTGVPTFVLDARHALSGAQPPEVWAQVIDRVAAG